jgi:ABC-type nitrate/sulfonate/bicarbonate transport system substrate-binding protein
MNRRIIRATLLVVLAVALAACGVSATSDGSDADGAPTAGSASEAESQPASPDGDAGAPRDVTVMLDWTPNTNHSGMYLAKANGFYEDAGLDVEIIQPGEQGGLPALASGDADIAVSVQEQLLPARAQGAPVVSVAAIIPTNTSSLVMLADEGIERPADLAGHRYGGFGGELETELVSRLVECDGGDPEAVDFVEVGNVDYRAGLERDFYDFVWIFDGWDGIRLEQAGVDTTTIPFDEHFDCIPNWYTPLLATSESLIDDEPEVVAAFMEATTRGYELAASDPTAAADALLADAPELDEDLVRASAEYLAPEYAPDGAWGVQDPQVWTEFTAFLSEAGILSGDIDVDAAWTNDFLPGADAVEGDAASAAPSG